MLKRHFFLAAALPLWGLQPALAADAGDDGATQQFIARLRPGTHPVSYTHLDVYKRQMLKSPITTSFGCAFSSSASQPCTASSQRSL